MNTSIKKLSEEDQRHLQVLVAIILQEMKNIEMIILFGSYAKGEQVSFDRRVEFGISTSYRSDYDLLVIASHIKNEPAFSKKINKVGAQFREKTKSEVPVRIIHNTFGKISEFLEKGDYFYSTIRNEGIVLYDTGAFVLPEPRQLELFEIEREVRDYYADFFHKGERFLANAKIFDYPDAEYGMAAFHLHQACECFFYAISLTYTLYKPKEHDIEFLINYNKKFSSEVLTIFPKVTEQNEHLFELLKNSYVQSRYNIRFKAKAEDIATLIQWIEHLRDKTREICSEKLFELERQVASSQAEYRPLKEDKEETSE